MNEELLKQLMNCPELPTLPGVALQILQLARDPDADIHTMADLISTDSALSGKILKTVNSSFYGLSKTVSTISQALVILGLQSVRTLALGFSLISSISKAGQKGFDPMIYWRRSIYSAVAARTLGQRIKLVQTEEAFLAALLQDIGMLAMHQAIGETYDQLHAQAPRHEELQPIEDTRLQLNHAQVGQAMGERWSLSPVLYTPVACHHDPTQAPEDLRKLANVVHVAWRFAEVFLQSQHEETIVAATEAADSMLDLTSGQVQGLLEEVNASVDEAADLFEVNIGDRTNSGEILAQARDVLVNITLRSQQMASELKDRNEELRQAAATDPLTGLANRARFDEALAEQFQHARQTRGDLSVLFVDADHFKNVNDTYGHSTGDMVLRRLATMVKEICGRGTVGRYGGEEITCVLPETDLRTAAHLAENIRVAVSEEVVFASGRHVSITVSIGVASMTAGQFFESSQRLLNYADRALYAAKRDGRNAVRICAAPAEPQRASTRT